MFRRPRNALFAAGISPTSAEPSFAICGARWRTCACTEDDQAEQARQTGGNLERVKVAARAEEEEIRAAIVAVEDAETRLEDEQRQEEARHITMRDDQE
ncbi:MAG: hypothetical protein Q9226_000517 [Calogaya cf. arnoldii]